MEFQARYVKVAIKLIDGTILNGKVNLSSKQRVSDLFTKSSNPFIVVVGALSKDTEDKIMFINKNHIIWVEPDDN
jgi:AAA+ ATPase superfamily predicted ATPase